MQSEMRKSFCSTCGDFVSSSIQNVTETFNVRNVDITITSPARIAERLFLMRFLMMKS